MNAVEKLGEKLKEMGVTRIGVSVNPDTNPKTEEVAQAMLESIERLERGEFEIVANLDD